MDDRRFDAAIRAFQAGATRRTGLAAAAGVLLGGAGLRGAAAATDQPETASSPAAQGPCGDGSAADNRCQRMRDCCTGYCVGGLCRCKPNWMSCRRDAQCCGGRCVDGRCDGGCRQSGARCEEQFNCCSGMSCEKGVCTRDAGATCSGKTCDGCCDGTTCRPGGSPAACGAGGRACRRCGGSKPACEDGACAPCTSDRQCSGATPSCDGGTCEECAGAKSCGADAEACVAAACTCGSDISCDGDAGVCCSVLGAVAPVAAPGYRLQMTQLVWDPGSSVIPHSHPIAQVACVNSGALGMTLQQGAATVTRAGSGTGPATIEQMPLNTPVIIGPGDCIAYDEFAEHTVHTVWNASDGTTVLWMSDLVRKGEPYTELPGPRMASGAGA